MIYKAPQKNEVIRNLSACVIEKISRFNIIKISNEDKIIEGFVATNIVYEPVKYYKHKINCYFTNMFQLAYRSTMTKGKDK